MAAVPIGNWPLLWALVVLLHMYSKVLSAVAEVLQQNVCRMGEEMIHHA